jgi:hypothetical protein
MTGLYGLTIGVIIIGIGSAHNKDQRDGWLYGLTIGVIIIGIGSAFCTHVRRIKEVTGLYGLTIGVIIIGIGSAHT